MTSDKERCEIVEFLRSDAHSICTGAPCCERCGSVSRAVFGNSVVLCRLESNPGVESWRRLADLIDRPTCVMNDIGDEFEQEFQCSNCQSTFEMGDFERFPYRYCPNCGAEVVE